MRKKIREIINKEEGFTLVELLAVLAILAIIIAIAIPAIGNVISRSKTQATAAEEELIVDAGRLYFTTSGNTEKTQVTVKTLHEEGYLEDRGAAEGESSLPSGGVKKVADSSNPKIFNYIFDSTITEGE